MQLGGAAAYYCTRYAHIPWRLHIAADANSASTALVPIPQFSQPFLQDQLVVILDLGERNPDPRQGPSMGHSPYGLEDLTIVGNLKSDPRSWARRVRGKHSASE